jgi:hypothetical protein
LINYWSNGVLERWRIGIDRRVIKSCGSDYPLLQHSNTPTLRPIGVDKSHIKINSAWGL